MGYNNGIWCSWYTKEGHLRVDKAYGTSQKDAMQRHCMNIGGSDFMTGIEGTKRPQTKEVTE